MKGSSKSQCIQAAWAQEKRFGRAFLAYPKVELVEINIALVIFLLNTLWAVPVIAHSVFLDTVLAIIFKMEMTFLQIELLGEINRALAICVPENCASILVKALFGFIDTVLANIFKEVVFLRIGFLVEINRAHAMFFPDSCASILVKNLYDFHGDALFVILNETLATIVTDAMFAGAASISMFFDTFYDNLDNADGDSYYNSSCTDSKGDDGSEESDVTNC